MNLSELMQRSILNIRELYLVAKPWQMFISIHYLTCRNGYDHTIALMLSVFLGMFGMDRFYLGYPALGCSTLTLGAFLYW